MSTPEPLTELQRAVNQYDILFSTEPVNEKDAETQLKIVRELQSSVMRSASNLTYNAEVRLKETKQNDK